jgi:hypothetical protein
MPWLRAQRRPAGIEVEDEVVIAAPHHHPMSSHLYRHQSTTKATDQ